MTWRTIWTPSGSYFPAHCDHASEEEANRHALLMSREIQGEVAVVPLPNETEGDLMSEHSNETAYTGHRTKPNPAQPDRCPSIDPHDTLQCGRRIHDDDQCRFDGIAWKKGTRPPHEQHHPWGPLEAALVTTLADWKIQCDARQPSGKGSDCSDLMDVALTRIKGLCSKALDPGDVLAEIDGDVSSPPKQAKESA